jgi:hypothetical protein
MAHFAELDENNIVIRVLKTNNDDPNGDEGYQWLLDRLGGRWVKTSWNTRGGVHIAGGTPFRMNYAGAGMYYDEEKDAFIPVKHFDSWILNEDTCQWESPVPHPEPENIDDYRWDETTTSWIEVQ